ncbi:MAG TPA: hypothetical protein VGI45_31575 [Terracidiphilus sp.]
MALAPEILTTSGVLAQVFDPEGPAHRPADHERRRVHAISQGGEPRWIIIGSPGAAMPVLKSWSPWNKTSRIQWSVLQAAAAADALRFLPRVSNSVFDVDVAYWRGCLPTFPDQWSAVIHIGSPSYTRKAILFLIENGARVTAAAKVPLAPESAAAIFNEADMLDHLSRFDYLPRVLFRDRSRGIAAQSWLDGKPVGRGFGQPHLDLLNSLACAEGSVRVCDDRLSLQNTLDKSDLPFDRSVLVRGMDMLECDVLLPAFVEHRDFAPWNLKWIRPGVLGLLDWEWAEPVGLPWQDACRYFYLDDIHFHGSGRVWEMLIANDVLRSYRQHFEIPDRALPALTMRYLLRELLMEWDGGNRRLANYAYRQICALLAAMAPHKD